MILIMYVSTTVFSTQGNYIGYMFRLLNSHLQASAPCDLPVNNRPEYDCSVVETCSLFNYFV